MSKYKRVSSLMELREKNKSKFKGKNQKLSNLDNKYLMSKLGIKISNEEIKQNKDSSNYYNTHINKKKLKNENNYKW